MFGVPVLAAVPLMLLAGAAPVAASELTTFRTPSGNIACAMDDAGVVCEVRLPRFTPPPRPKDCEGDWGQTLMLDRRRARFVCATDTPAEPDSTVLAYGTSKRVAGYVCTSSRQGLRCEHGRSGRGFTLSRSSYRLF